MSDDNPFLAAKANPFIQAQPAAAPAYPGGVSNPTQPVDQQPPAPEAASPLHTPPGERVGGSRSWRNNNPGNIEYGDYAQSRGATGGDGRFAKFPDYETGRSAQEHLLFESPNYAGLTLPDAVKRWAPASENNVPAYIEALKKSGVDPNTPMGHIPKESRASVLDAMQQHEGWQPGIEQKMAYQMPAQAAAPVQNKLQSSDNPFLKDLQAKKPNPFLQPPAKPEGRSVLGEIGHALDIRPQIKETLETGKKAMRFAPAALGGAVGGIPGAIVGQLGAEAYGLASHAIGQGAEKAADYLVPGQKFVKAGPTEQVLNTLPFAIGAGPKAGATAAPGAPSEVPPATTIPEAKTPLPYATTEAAGDAGILNTQKNPFFDKPGKPPVVSGPQGTHAPAELPDRPFGVDPAKVKPEDTVQAPLSRAGYYSRPASPAEEIAVSSLHTDKTMRQVGNLMGTLQGTPHEVPFEDMRYIIGPDGSIHWGDSRTFDHNAMADAAGYTGGDKQAVLGGTLKPEEFAAARAQFKTTEEFNDWLHATALPGNMNKGAPPPMDEILPMPKDVGAAQTPVGARTLGKSDITALEHTLNEHPRELGRAANDTLHFLLDDPYKDNPAMSDAMSGLVDSRNIGAMDPAQREVYDQYYKPVMDANEAMHGELTAIARRDLGMTPQEANDFVGYQKGSLPRLTKQYTKFWNEMTQHGDTLTGDQLADTLRETPTMHETDYDTMVNNQTGERVVVKKGTGYVNSVRDGQRWNLEGDFSYGKQATAEDGSAWHLERGTGAEIEEQLGRKHGEMYDHNIARQIGYTNATLRWKLASARLVQSLKNDPKLNLRYYHGDHMPSQWRSLQYRDLNYPGLNHYAAPKRVAEVFADYSPSRMHDMPWYRAMTAISRRLTQSVFWQPFGHILNTAQLALQNTGWHSLDPRRWPESVADLGRAWRDTAAGGTRWHEWEKVPGAALESMRGKNRALTRQYMKTVAKYMKQDPAGTGLAAWAKQLGVQPMKLYDAWYNKSSDMLWNGSDTMTLWRLERNLKEVNSRAGRAPLDRAGMPESVKLTHKDAPDYFMPSRLWEGPGGRAASEFLRFTPLNVFGRYHYNVANGLLQIAKDMVGPNASTSDRLMAGGKVINLGLMMMALNMADNMYQTMTGDKKHEFSAHGSGSILKTAQNIASGKAYTVGDIARTVGVSEAPAAQAATELGSFLGNQHGADVFGRPILNPGDTPGRHALQMADWAANKFPPWQMANEMAKAPNLAAAAIDPVIGMTRTKMDQKRANQLSGGVPSTGRIESLVTGSPYDKKRNLTKHRRLRPEQ